jgi:uncharacterized RDD family membrane protein YckC
MNDSYAGLWPRTKAFALDYLIIVGYLLFLVALGLAVNLTYPTITQTLFGNPISGQLTGFLVVTLPVTLYFALLESSAWQATWGKRKLGLRVIRTDGARLSFLRALARTGVKFIPWELAHTCIWQIRFAAEESSPFITAGFAFVWLLAGLYILSLHISKTHQALYDQVAGTVVIATPAP